MVLREGLERVAARASFDVLRWWLTTLGALLFAGLASLLAEFETIQPGTQPAEHAIRVVTAVRTTLLATGVLALMMAVAGSLLTWRRLELFARLEHDPRPPRLLELSRLEFESCVCELYRRLGYSIRPRRGIGDGLFVLDNRRASSRLLCCKHWPHALAGPRELGEVARLASTLGCKRGVLVTSGVFVEGTPGDDSHDTECVDGAELLRRVVTLRHGRAVSAV